MKFKLLFLSLIVWFNGSAQTNIYHPYPQGWGATWQTEAVIGGSGGPNYSYGAREWGGDTIINSISYTKVYDGIGLGHQYIGGVRQDINQEEAYFIDDQNVEHDISIRANSLESEMIKN